MALNTNALTTLAMMKTYLGIGVSDTSQDTLIEYFINVTSDAIERYTQRKLKQVSITEYQDGRNQDRLLLKEWPASKPSAVYSDSNWTFDSTTLIDSASYDVTNETDLVLNSGVFPKGKRNIKVVYTAGYSTIPSALEHACILFTENIYMARSDRRNGVNSKSKSGENVTFLDGMTAQIQQLLEPFVRTDFALNQSMENI